MGFGNRRTGASIRGGIFMIRVPYNMIKTFIIAVPLLLAPLFAHLFATGAAPAPNRQKWLRPLAKRP